MKSLQASIWAVGFGAFFAGLIIGIAVPHPLLLGSYFPEQASRLYSPKSVAFQGGESCLPLICENGKVFPSCACNNKDCHEIAYLSNPCTEQAPSPEETHASPLASASPAPDEG